MTKKITFLFILLAVSLGFSQQTVLEDFDGAAPTFAGFEGLGSATITAGALELVSSSGGQPWQGAELIMQNNMIDLTSDITVNLDIDSSTAFDMFVKVEDGTGPDSATATAHTGSGLETLTFTFNQSLDGTGVANGEYEKIVFFLNWNIGVGWNNPPAAFTITIDNITAVAGSAIAGPTCTDGIQNGDETGVDCGGATCPTCPPSCTDGIQNGDETGVDCGGTSCAACPTPPTTAAPTPPARAAADVISLYSDAYTDVASNFDAGWCGGSSVAEVMIAGNATQAYLGNACQGIVLDAGVDASTFAFLHCDIYIQGGTDVTSSVFNLKFVNQPGGAAVEVLLNAASTPALIAGSWISVDVPVNLAGITGFKEFGVTSNLQNKVWYDNLYAHKGTTLSAQDFNKTSFSVFPNPSQSSWTVKTQDVRMASIRVFDILGKNVLSLTPNTIETVIDGSSLKAGLYFAQIKTETGINSIKLIKE